MIGKQAKFRLKDWKSAEFSLSNSLIRKIVNWTSFVHIQSYLCKLRSEIQGSVRFQFEWSQISQVKFKFNLTIKFNHP